MNWKDFWKEVLDLGDSNGLDIETLEEHKDKVKKHWRIGSNVFDVFELVFEDVL